MRNFHFFLCFFCIHPNPPFEPAMQGDLPITASKLYSANEGQTMQQRCLNDILAVGTLSFVQFDLHRKDAKRYPVLIRGWEENRFIFLDRPRLDDGRYLLLRENQDCIVRFAVNGIACAFTTSILDWDMRPHAAYMRLAWPKKYECTAFRKQERLPIHCPAKIALPDGILLDAALFDISPNGCGVLSCAPLEAGTEISLHLQLPDGTPLYGLKATVRNKRTRDDGFAIGCSFADGQPEHTNALTFYFATRAQLERGQGTAHPEIHGLVLDHSPALAAKIIESLHGSGITALHSAGLIDAFYRLRFLRPAFLLIRDEMLVRAAPAVWQELAPLQSSHGKPIEIVVYGNAPLPENLLSGLPKHLRIHADEDLAPLKLLKHLKTIHKTAQDPTTNT
jgi:hypothetical protein